MSRGKLPTTICNGCRTETDETVWWRHVTEQTRTNDGFCYDMICPDKDYCRDCWNIMEAAIREHRKSEAMKVSMETRDTVLPTT